MATSRKPQELRKRSAASSVAPSASVSCARFISPVSGSYLASWMSLRSRSWRASIARTTPCARNGLPSGPANQRPVSSSQIFSPLSALLEGVLHLIGNAGAAVALAAVGDRVQAAVPVFGLDARRVGAAAGDLGDRDAEHGRGIAAPAQRVGVEPPFIGGLADRIENRRRVGRAGRGIETGHARPFLGTLGPRRALVSAMDTACKLREILK